MNDDARTFAGAMWIGNTFAGEPLSADGDHWQTCTIRWNTATGEAEMWLNGARSHQFTIADCQQIIRLAPELGGTVDPQ